ncbi:hypothetical protein DFR49_0974 [Hephaestia caeni]|uniref:Uncharacterized protein n=2 Tax=Hephaestia caeni TaxID=645617 RepID=A0A397PBG3_9SPHN|nr:hypothetical protein DFR49_0974 [Hephaestia caeni]
MPISAHIPTSHNTPGAQATPYSMEIEDKIMATLPKPLANWLRYDATQDYCPVAIFKEWRASEKGGDGMTVDQLLASLRATRRIDTQRAYGWSHPQAFGSQFS